MFNFIKKLMFDLINSILCSEKLPYTYVPTCDGIKDGVLSIFNLQILLSVPIILTKYCAIAHT